ncbi:MAG: outer membrane protein transport protein [Dysgonamonadaceae bacterium]|jgi:hypothetical protein|nr:outer membrane protein transport protein [Dysgonamonadaceae bacterium]
MKRNLLFVIALFVCAYAFGQGEIDAHRYATHDLSGTARGQAMGGAFGALGGDVTGVAINPAGVGVYRASEIVANMSVASVNVETDAKAGWNGTPNSLGKTKFNFDNLSYVGYYPSVKSGVYALNFGFNYNRVKNFDRKYSASGSNMSSSLTDYMVTLTNGFQDAYLNYNSDAPWLSVLAWEGGLINPKSGKSNEYESLLSEGETVSPKMNVTEKGYIEAYDFTLGSNISDKFFWGVTFSLTDIHYSMSSDYGEDFAGGSGFTLENYLETNASGYQFKAGLIVKPIDALRLGVSYHSPIWYSLTDYYFANLTPDNIFIDGSLVGRQTTPSDNWNYQFQTPYTWTFSAAAIIGTQGIISLDYETKNYASMYLKDRNGREYSDNQYIGEDFQSASTLRIGAEYRFTPQFSGRLGYALMQNPYDATFKSGGKEVMTAGTVPHYTIDEDATYYTAGIGYRFTQQFYIDFAFIYRQQDSDLYFYTPVKNIETNEQIVHSYPASFKSKTYKGLLTLGYKF